MGGLITLFKRSWQSFGADKCATLAAAIAYYTVFALFPMAFVGVALLGFVVGDASARQNVIDAITKIIPLGDQGAQGLSKTLAGAARAKGVLGLIGIATAAWSASGLFGAIRSALDSVWDVDRPLPLLRGKARDLLLFFAFGGLLGLSTTSTGFLQGARTAGHSSVLGPIIDLGGPVFWLLTLAVPLAITFCAFMVLYKVAPHARLSWGNVWPAAVIAAVFFAFGTNLLTFYIAHMGNLNALAGSLGAAILFLVFIYYSAQVILLGAEFAKHRMLVASGAVPASDPKRQAATPSLPEKLKGTLKRSWVTEQRHHETDLPYAPGRMDPVSDAPTNTKEEVLLLQRQAAEQAERDAGDAGNNQASGTGDQGKRDMAAAPVLPAQGEPAGSVPFGSWASTRPGSEQPASPRQQQDNSVLWRGIGYLIALLLSLVVKRRERQAAKLKAARLKLQVQQRPRRRLL